MTGGTNEAKAPPVKSSGDDASAGFAAASASAAEESEKKKSADPLDVIMAILLVLILITAFVVAGGYGVHALGTWMFLYGLAYLNAPARTFPKAEDVTPDMTGRVCAVTGATSGIGVDTARVLALRGAKVYMIARSEEKLKSTEERIRGELSRSSEHNGKGSLHSIVCDLSDLRSVKSCAEAFLREQSTLDVLVNNAGIMALPFRKSTAQGLESQVGVCHVGHFLLTNLLLPALERGASSSSSSSSCSRVVCLSSSAHRRHDMASCLQHAQLETVPYREWTAYGNAKCANLLHAAALHDRFYVARKKKDGAADADAGAAGHGRIAAFSVMPGGIHTGLQAHVGWWTMLKWYVVTPFFFKSTSQGAATTLLCATTASPEEHGGQYFDNCAPQPQALEKVLKEVGSKDAPERLWTATEQLLSNLSF